MESRTAPPVLFNPFIGDTLYNYRSALDHLAWRLVLEEGGTPDHRTAFVISDAPDRFQRSSFRLNGMSDLMRAAIEDLQPYHGRHSYRDPLLRALESLGNIDKHRHFNLTLSASDGGFWKPVLPTGAASEVFIYSGPVQDGTVLARVPREYVDVDFFPALGMAFDESGPTIREVFFGINEVVASIIENFASDFLGESISLQRW